MTRTSLRRARLGAGVVALATATAVGGLTLPATATGAGTPTVAAADGIHPDDVVTLGDPVHGPEDVDLREAVQPTGAQRRAAARLGAVDLSWNQFGTPSSVLPADGSLGAASPASAVRDARAWLRRNAAVFGLTATQVADLELVSEQLFAGSTRTSGPRSVLFRQRFGGLSAAIDSMVTVGVGSSGIAFVSSSLSPTSAAPPAAELDPQEAWLKAAADLGRTVPAADVAEIVTSEADGWTQLQVPGFAQTGMVRLRSLAMGDGVVRPVFEANVVDTEGGAAFAFTSLVDAVDGRVLHRHNQVDHSNDAFTFQGTITASECGPLHPFELTDGNTRQIVATSVGTPTDDHVIRLTRPNGEVLVNGDLATNPETATYSGDPLPAGVYNAQVCPYQPPIAPVVVGPYSLTVVTSDSESPGVDSAQFSPRWRFFPSNPSLGGITAGVQSAGDVIGCWVHRAGCTLSTKGLKNVQAPGPWDAYTAGGASTQTTTGNNANTREAWLSPLTPGGANQAPVSPTREYTDEFEDIWNDERCDPTTLRPGGNDILASVTSLFVNHNRMHDYSYYLGFTEANYNLQTDNLGRGGTPGDPEIGNVQAGAIGGLQSGFGRDNANQITLQDGVPGITNQYLFQPIAGAFYAPCTDGGLDQSIVGHEYTHAISNRMVGGPDQGLTSEHGGAMGESWSDLVAAEYMFAHDYDTGANPWAVGPYATGNRSAGIRDFPINRNPLNFSNYGFDTTGDEVHADGEIWNGTMWTVRQALVKKYNARYPYRSKVAQLRCSKGTSTRSPYPAWRCPGNRRWLQLMFDSFLLQQGATSMVDARNAFLAADTLRFNGDNRREIWRAFARRGFGKGASTPSADSGDTKASFAAPGVRNTKVTFRTAGKGEVYVGHFEARSTPVADTLRSTERDAVTTFAPGRYRMLYVSRTHGFKRFTMTVGKGRTQVVRVRGAKNLAAGAAGAKVLRATDGSRNAAFLIDGTESTNWGGVTEENVDRSKPTVEVDLAGRRVQTIRRVQVSAMLRPATGGGDELPLARVDEDPDSGSRFTALRRFALEACVRRCGTSSATWRRVFVSEADAFPTKRPRPVAPNLTMRSFQVDPFRAAAVRLVTLHNQCTGNPAFAGEQDNDPSNDTDCASASDRGTIVHAAELQVFRR